MSDERREVALFRAVILRALEDGQGILSGFSGGAIARRREIDDARAFFNADNPGCRAVCDAADLNPEWVVRRAEELFRRVDAGEKPRVVKLGGEEEAA